MASVAIEFDKTLQERLDEYKEIFLWSSEAKNKTSICHKSVSSHLIKQFWGNHLSVVLYPEGWKAVWRIPIRKCILMDLKHPSDVLVEVISIDWENLSADVQVLKINEHYVPSSKRVAALSELFPVEEQSRDCDPWLIANELDKYRFFNEYLWFPWDEVEDDIHSWTESYLEQRIQLWYDMIVGEVNPEDSERMRHLISEARHLQAELEETERMMEELDDELDVNKDPEEMEDLDASFHQMSVHDKVGKEKEEKEEILMVRLLFLKRILKDIQYEFEALEDPVLRKALADVKLRNLRREYQMNNKEVLNNNYHGNDAQKEKIKNVALVCDKSSFQEIKELLNYAESKFSDSEHCSVGFFHNIQVAIELAHSKATAYLLSPGAHIMDFTVDLLIPGTTLAGIPEGISSVPSLIRGHSLGRTMMVVDWGKDQSSPTEEEDISYLENLHFDPYGIEAVLLIDCGSISVKKCHFGNEEYHDLPVIGAHSTPSTSILPSYSHHHSIWKENEDGSSEYNPLLPLPISAAFECPKQRGIAVGAHGILNAQDCHFEGLHLAIIAYCGAKVTLSNCVFSKCNIAIRISRGAQVTAENCIFEKSLSNAIQYCAGHMYEQDEETREIMAGKEELFTSSQILPRIPGVSFKECIFISGDNSDVCLRSVGEIAKSPNIKRTAPSEKLVEENVNESVTILDEKEDDSIIILSDNN